MSSHCCRCGYICNRFDSSQLRKKPSNETLLCVAFVSFMGFASIQVVVAFIAQSEAMIGDSAAMIVDSMTYGFNLYAERKKNEDVEQIIQTTEIEMNCQLDDNDTDDIITTDNDSYNLERIRLSKRKKILHYELVPPVLSVSVLLVVTGFVLYGSISTLILDTNRSEEEQSTPNLIIMMSFAIFNLFLDLFNVSCFARAKHLLGYKTESEIKLYMIMTMMMTNHSIL